MKKNKLIEIALTVLLTSGLTSIISLFISKNIQLEVSSYQLKLEKYSALGEELAKVASNDFNPKSFDQALNGSLVFASPKVVFAIQNLLTKMGGNKLPIDANGSQIIYRDELMPIIMAIREDLGESNVGFQKNNLWFSQTSNPQCPQ